MRFNAWAAAVAPLERAVSLSRALGPTGYETEVAALSLLVRVLPVLGQPDKARATFETLMALTRSSGDRNHELAALSAVYTLEIALGDLSRALDSQARCVALGRELGNTLVTAYAEFNMGELLYLADRLDEVSSHLQRAKALSQRPSEVGFLAAIEITEARRLVRQGAFTEAVARVEPWLARPEVLFANYAVLAKMVVLRASRAPRPEWEQLVATSEQASLEEEPVELREMFARTLFEQGDDAGGRAVLREAQTLTAQRFMLVSARVEQLAREHA